LAEDFSPETFRGGLLVNKGLDEGRQSGRSDLFVFVHHQGGEVSEDWEPKFFKLECLQVGVLHNHSLFFI
jgi:hypothetical protein